MTKEEAIVVLQKIKPIPHRGDGKSTTHTLEIIALDMAIKALEQQPCEDCISRQATIDAIYKKYIGGKDAIENAPINDLYADGLAEAVDAVWDMPPVTPQPKKGHWIMPAYDDGMSEPIYYQVRCSECGFDLDPQTWHMELHQYGADRYCPNCGCRMESEDKE